VDVSGQQPRALERIGGNGGAGGGGGRGLGG